MAKPRVPDFFIVGHPKCGTTALYETLRRHPGIFMPDVKEPRYLASDAFVRQARFSAGSELDSYAALFAATDDDRAAPAASPQLAYSREAPRAIAGIETLGDYLALFARAGNDQLAGEASPQYLASRAAPKAIAALSPQARVIAIFREPAAFLASMYLQLVQNRAEKAPDLRAALRFDEFEPAGARDGETLTVAQLRYWSRLRYADQLCRYHAVLPRHQVLDLAYDDFRDDNTATVCQVLQFLGADSSVPLALPRPTRPSGCARCACAKPCTSCATGGEARWPPP
ncbi:MAG: sulfotransferase [Acidimicrobiales bacterium]